MTARDESFSVGRLWLAWLFGLRGINRGRYRLSAVVRHGRTVSKEPRATVAVRVFSGLPQGLFGSFFGALAYVVRVFAERRCAAERSEQP